LPCLAASNSGWKAAGLSLSSAQYRRWNSFHLTGSWLNQRRRSPLGARFLHQASICNASFFIPRGHRRSTRKRAPSSFAHGSYTRLIWITDDLYPRVWDRSCFDASLCASDLGPYRSWVNALMSFSRKPEQLLLSSKSALETSWA